MGGKAPLQAFSIPPLHGNTYYLFLYESAHKIRTLQPVFADLDANILATARGSSEGVDFVSRLRTGLNFSINFFD